MNNQKDYSAVNVNYLRDALNDPKRFIDFSEPVLKFSGDNYFIRGIERRPYGESKKICLTVDKPEFDKLKILTQLNNPEDA